jgi:hypothetical protein
MLFEAMEVHFTEESQLVSCFDFIAFITKGIF